jgi:hypothetical protein
MVFCGGAGVQGYLVVFCVFLGALSLHGIFNFLKSWLFSVVFWGLWGSWLCWCFGGGWFLGLPGAAWGACGLCGLKACFRFFKKLADFQDRGYMLFQGPHGILNLADLWPFFGSGGIQFFKKLPDF